MIFDLLDSKYGFRLITKNVMSVFSTSKASTDDFINLLKSSTYSTNNSIVTADRIISTKITNLNLYENVYRFIKHQKNITYSKVFEYLSYFNINHILWLKLNQITNEELTLLQLAIQLSTTKPIILLDYIEEYRIKYNIYSILYYIGLQDKLIIVPFTNIEEAVNHSTCQCYIKNNLGVRVMSKFPVEYLNYEFNTSCNYYNNTHINLYNNTTVPVIPVNYNYTVVDIILIILYKIKILLLSASNWRTKNYGIRLHNRLF